MRGGGGQPANRLKGSAASLSTVFAADTFWGIAALLWISTGLWRVFGSIEKTSSYYWSNHIFLAKMGLLVVILALETWPMITLIKWRRAGASIDASELARKGRLIARISDVELLLVVGMVIAATMMARGYGAR